MQDSEIGQKQQQQCIPFIEEEGRHELLTDDHGKWSQASGASLDGVASAGGIEMGLDGTDQHFRLALPALLRENNDISTFSG